MNENLIVNYSNALKLNNICIGNKAYSIVKLYQLGFNVPQGFIITTDTCSKLLKNNSEELSNSIFKIIKNKFIFEKYAVRSSAVGEDSILCSWAGCFDSFLDIKREDLIKYIYMCCNSIFNERVSAYRRLHNNSFEITKIAVLAQEYINAEWNGVCFSANPVTNDRSEYILEMQKGKSGTVVGGLGKVITIVANSSDKQFLLPNEVPDTLGLELMHTIKEIDKHWGVPVDVEWVFSNLKLFITQVRPITTIIS